MPFTDAVPVPGEYRAPGKRAEHGDQGENAEAHADNAGGNGNEVADNGQKAGEEDTGNFVPLKEDFRLFHLVGRHEKEFAPAHDDRAAHDSGHGVGNGRTQPGAERSGSHHSPEAHGCSFLGGQDGRGRDDHFAGNGKDGAFHGHQDDDTRISPVLHPGHPK